MSEESPAFQWYAADYLADGKVQLATSAQEGIYIRLLSYCWRELTIPADPKVARLLCKPDALIEDVVFVLKAFFTSSKDDGLLIHKRLEEERKKQRKNRKQRAEAGRKSGEARRLKTEQPLNERSNGRSDSVATKTNSSTSSSISTSSSDLKVEDTAVKPEIVMTFPVSGKPHSWDLTADQLREWETLFPALDIRAQCNYALAWVKANHAKTSKGMTKFLVNWFSRATNSGHVKNGNSGNGTGTHRPTASERIQKNPVASNGSDAEIFARAEREALARGMDEESANGVQGPSGETQMEIFTG